MQSLKLSKDSSSIDFSLDELVEFFPTYSLSSIAADRANYLNKLFIRVPVLQLLIDIPQIVKIQLSFSLDVQQSKVCSSCLLIERASLNSQQNTILAVSYLRNCSKSKAAPLVEPWISESSLKTNSYLESRPRVLAVMRTSLISALLCLGSA